MGYFTTNQRSPQLDSFHVDPLPAALSISNEPLKL